MDAILAKVGPERFFQYIMCRLKVLYPTRDYKRAIKLSTGQYYNEDNFDIIPDAVRRLLAHVQDVANVATEDEGITIKSQLQEVEGFIEVPEKKKEILHQLAKVLREDKDMKVIIANCEELMAGLTELPLDK
jgi:hypothetical protein